MAQPPVTPAAGDIMHWAPDAPVLMCTYTCTIRNQKKKFIKQSSLAGQLPGQRNTQQNGCLTLSDATEMGGIISPLMSYWTSPSRIPAPRTVPKSHLRFFCWSFSPC